MAGTLLDLRKQILGELGPDAVKYELGCGQTCEPGFIGLDLHSPSPGVRNVDLFKFPWPIESGTVDYFRSSHFVEHVPDWDAHFEEVHRCLKVGGHYEVTAPYYRNDRFVQDPDHKQPVSHQRFTYLRREWLVTNKIEHGRPRVNMIPVGGWFELLHEDYRDSGMDAHDLNWHKAHMWNVIDDLAVILVKEPIAEEESK